MVFFVALAQLGGAAQGLAWLAWIPLFTPFMLLLEPPGALGVAQTVGALAGMGATTVAFGWLATRALTGSGLPRLRAERRVTGERQRSLAAEAG
jgi:hypothetical protein